MCKVWNIWQNMADQELPRCLSGKNVEAWIGIARNHIKKAALVRAFNPIAPTVTGETEAGESSLVPRDSWKSTCNYNQQIYTVYNNEVRNTPELASDHHPWVVADSPFTQEP